MHVYSRMVDDETWTMKHFLEPRKARNPRNRYVEAELGLFEFGVLDFFDREIYERLGAWVDRGISRYLECRV